MADTEKILKLKEAVTGTLSSTNINTNATPNYAINSNDKRFTDITKAKNEALSDSEETYDSMINQSDSFYNAQKQAVEEYGQTQQQLQQEQTDFAIEQIEQQKDKAEQDYQKEQSAAYVDYQKESNKYGVNAEEMAANGMSNSGYSESSQVAMYTAYQNRVASARESYNEAVLSYDNAIKDARLQNNSALAEIAYNTLQQSLEFSLQGFQYKNQLLLEKANKALEIDQMYYSRYQDVINQINTENALAEQVRQFNESQAQDQAQFDASLAQDQAQFDASMAWEKEQYEGNMELAWAEYNTAVTQWQKEYDLQVDQFNESIRQFNKELKRLKAQDKAENAYKIAALEAEKEAAEQAHNEWLEEMKLQWAEYELQKKALESG